MCPSMATRLASSRRADVSSPSVSSPGLVVPKVPAPERLGPVEHRGEISEDGGGRVAPEAPVKLVRSRRIHTINLVRGCDSEPPDRRASAQEFPEKEDRRRWAGSAQQIVNSRLVPAQSQADTERSASADMACWLRPG